LKNTVFNKSEFKSWASKNVILVELDFPKRTPISDELKKQNRELAALFRVRGYPTVWFVTPKSENGNVSLNKLGSLGATPLDVNAWVGAASEIIK
jgi:protein disulfide-isomerase